jgi:hypothetical protein
MEYGYEIVDTAGNKTFFVEGCTCCSMSTGGVHELGCPYYKGGHYKPSPRFDPATFYEAPYPKFVREQMALVDAHPEWGVSYL